MTAWYGLIDLATRLVGGRRFEATILPVRIPEAVSTLYYPLRLLLHPSFTCKRAFHPPFSLPSITGLLHACVGGKQPSSFPDGRVLGGRRDTYLSMGGPLLTCAITLVPTGAPIHLPTTILDRTRKTVCWLLLAVRRPAHPGP